MTNPNFSSLSVGHFLDIYKRRMEGWESGLLAYPELLYEMVKHLVENLKKYPEEAPCQIKSEKVDGKRVSLFYVNDIQVGFLDVTPGSERIRPTRTPDIEAEVTLLPAEQGGRKTPVYSGYRPQHQVMTGYHTSGEHEYFESEELFPGESGKAFVRFITPDAYPKTIWVGRELEIFEGARIVGKLRVVRILNRDLEAPVPVVKKWNPELGIGE